MLYVTTRIRGDAFTACHALREDRGPKGGFYLPMTMPEFDRSFTESMKDRSFGQNAAAVLNLLFNRSLSGWDVEFAAGRHPIRRIDCGSKITIAETWHNPDWDFRRSVSNLVRTVSGMQDGDHPLSDWALIGVRVAFLCGIFGEMMASGVMKPEERMDLALPSGDFSAVMAAWYARSWGLPVGNLIICCNENNGIWSLIHQGELRTDAAVIPTDTPDCDRAVPAGLERLIFSCLGRQETERFLECLRCGAVYSLDPESQRKLGQGIRVSVVSRKRVQNMISVLDKDNGYIPDPYTAMVYGGLLERRAKSGEIRPTLIPAEISPAYFMDTVCQSLGMTALELKDRINNS